MGADKRMKGLNSVEGNGGSNSLALKTAEQLLPPEMWRLVFTQVESPEDLWNIFDTSPKWAKLLRATNFYFKMTLPFLFSHLSRQDVLACSAVSRSWNAAVDACLQYNEETNTGEGGRYVVRATLSSANMPRFIEKLTGSTGRMPAAISPIPFRNLFINIKLQAPMEPVLDPLVADRANLRKCLDHHGHHVRVCNLCLDLRGLAIVDGLYTLKLIRSCLKRMPNLRYFNIILSEEESNTDEEREAIKTNVSQNPMPPLKHLKTLVVKQFCNREELSSVAHAYSHQLEYLRFGYFQKEPQEPVQKSCLQRIDYALDTLGNGKALATFMQSNPSPLNHLKIEFPPRHNDADMNGLTDAVNAASATLENLELHPYMDRSQFEGPDFDIRKMKVLRLPKLKLFVLRCFTYPSLDFLHSVCPALEHLIVTPSFQVSNMRSGRMYRNLYSQHQFWKKLSRIQSVVVKLMFGARYAVEGKINGRSIRTIIDGGKQEIVYTRQRYEAKLAEALAPKRNRRRSTPEKSDHSQVTRQKEKDSSGPVTRSKKVYKRN